MVIVEINRSADQIEGIALIKSMMSKNNRERVEIKTKIRYQEKEYYFIDEFDSNDEIQQEIIWYQMQNIRVCCLNENGKHQLYARG